jgi:hypothetical protein
MRLSVHVAHLSQCCTQDSSVRAAQAGVSTHRQYTAVLQALARHKVTTAVPPQTICGQAGHHHLSAPHTPTQAAQAAAGAARRGSNSNTCLVSDLAALCSHLTVSKASYKQPPGTHDQGIMARRHQKQPASRHGALHIWGCMQGSLRVATRSQEGFVQEQQAAWSACRCTAAGAIYGVAACRDLPCRKLAVWTATVWLHVLGCSTGLLLCESGESWLIAGLRLPACQFKAAEMCQVHC